ncbi:MAG: S-layer homology domain-containing protein [Clostridiales bacterium]|nr:S-layer homology domain-containing protein [Clostridiales bacterium]
MDVLKNKCTALLLALLILAQVFAPEVAWAKSSEPSKQTTVQLVKMGALDPKTYPKLDNKTILAIQKQARENKKRTKRAPGAGLFSVDNPYLPGQNPTDEEKAAAYGKLKVKFKTFGLKENGIEKEFQWNEIFGTDSNGKPGTADIYFVQRDAETRDEKHRFKLTVDKAGDYTLKDIYGNPALLPLYSRDLKPYKYDVELDTGVSEKITLLTVKLSYSGDEVASFVKDSDGKIVATIPMDLQIAQTASTKFVSEWHTDVSENDRPAVNGDFDTHEGQDLRYFPFPKNNTDVLKLRMESYNLETDEYPGYDPQTPPHLRVVPEVNVEEDMLDDPATYTIDKVAKRITASGKTYKYNLQYDVINGGKLTMTEVIPVTFDANGGKFASITDPATEQKIVKEVDYDKDLTEMPEKPTKAGYAFMGWGVKADATEPVAKEAFKNIKEAKTVYAIWSEKDIQVPEIPLYETYKEGNFYSADPNDSGNNPYPDRVKNKAYINNEDGTVLTFSGQDYVSYFVPKDKKDGLDQEITVSERIEAENQFKKAISEEQSDPSENFRTVTWRFQIVNEKDKPVKPRIVKATFKVYKNIYPGLTDGSKPDYVPDEFVKVTVKPTDKAVNKQVKYYYVNPLAKVIIPEKDPTGNGDNKFVKWTMKADSAAGDGADYALAERHKFTEASTITAQYISDVIPQDGDTKPEGVSDNFVKVTFVPTDNGTMEGNKIFWVNPEKEVTIPVANPVGKQYFTFKDWKIGADAAGDKYIPTTAKKFTEATTITATYEEAKNIIPYDPKEPITRPEGYVRVTFAADPGLKLTEQKAYYVKKNAGITLGNADLVKPGYEAQTGYKFDKWDKEDTLVIETTDIVVTAKATKLATVIPEKDTNGNTNEKPTGYKEVTFVIKDDDKTKGSIDGVAKFYVNPTEYVTINPPATKAETGFEFGAWDKDASIPTVYDKDTTITGSFNGLKDVIPNKNPDGTENKKPAGYKTVTFVIDPATGGKIVDKEITVYYVNPAKEVTVPQPKTNAETGYEFEKWDQDTTTAKKYDKDTTVKGNFKKLDDIIPSTDANGNSNAKPDGYITVTFDKGEHGKEITGQTTYYVNPKAYPAKTIGNITKPTVTAETGWKQKAAPNAWDTPDATEIKGPGDVLVKAQYKALEDVIPKTTNDDSEKPDGYITVTFSTETNGKIKGTTDTTKVVYVNPNKAVVLKGHAPEVTPNTGFDFASWDTQIDKKIQYSNGDTIKALYNAKDDVIPQEKTDGSDKPAGYLTVTFDKGKNGTLSGKTVYYVKPDKEVTVPAPTVTPATGYEFEKWDKELTQTFPEDTTITAGYKALENIIPQKNTDGSDKPNGYVTVTFKADANGSLSGTTVYYVKPNTDIDLTNTADAITKNPNVGYTAEGGTWTPAIASKKYTADETYTFAFKPLADVIEKIDESTKKPEGYVTVKLIPTTKATDETKAEKVYFVNPKKKVTIENTPVGKEETINDIKYTYTFTGWTVTRGTINSWNNGTIKDKFIQDTEITAKYGTEVKIEKLIPAPVPKKDVVTPINDVPKPEDLIKNVPGSENDPLPKGTEITYKEQPKVDGTGKITAKVEVKYPNGKTVVVEVPITVVDNVVPQTGKDKPLVPDNYVKVTVDTTDTATDNSKFVKVFWVKPNVEVMIPDINDPTGKSEKDANGVTQTNNFKNWKLEDSNPEKTYEHGADTKGTFTAKETKIVAVYEQSKNVKPVPDNGKWVPKGSTPSAKDFIKNIYNADDPDGKNNLPPGTKFTFTNGDPDTNTSGTNKTTNITVTYPNGEVKKIDVTYNVTDDVVEQKDPDKKPDVPENFVKVIVKTTDKATEDITRTFWVDPSKEVTLPVDKPEGGIVKDNQGQPKKDRSGKVIHYKFDHWKPSLVGTFKQETTIEAQYTEPTSEPDITAGLITTYVDTKPTIEDYKEVIKGLSLEQEVSEIAIQTEPDVSKVGKTKAEIKITFKNGDVKTVTVPVKVVEKGTKPGSNTGGSGTIVVPSTPKPTPEKPSEGDLNKDDHYQYLIGYPDGTFAPNRGMTRAEVATMFTRLLKDRPVKWLHYSSGVSDIYAGDWYADTVGYAVEKGIVSGYPDGTFRPNQPITRAEFASIASRFAALTEEKDLSFSDLDASHWGYKAIRLAASNGWISGYPDNTFRPEQAISRAEVTSITNRMLNRYADLDWIDAHRAEVIRFSDVGRSDWFFEPVMEATMGHDFTRDKDGKAEHWTGLNGKTFI